MPCALSSAPISRWFAVSIIRFGYRLVLNCLSLIFHFWRDFTSLHHQHVLFNLIFSSYHNNGELCIVLSDGTVIWPPLSDPRTFVDFNFLYFPYSALQVTYQDKKKVCHNQISLSVSSHLATSRERVENAPQRQPSSCQFFYQSTYD